MIIANIKDAERYSSLHPLFKQLFDYVRSNDLLSVPVGRITLKGDELFINVSDAELKAREAQKLEVHRDYIDVHFPLSGDEIIGWKHTAELGKSDAPFDEPNDFAVFSEPAAKYFSLKPGEFCIVFPEDAHAPVIGEGKLRKLIAKVRL